MPHVDQSIESLNQQNFQIETIANELLQVKEEILNNQNHHNHQQQQQQQQQQINIVQNFINDSNHISENSKLIDFEFVNQNYNDSTINNHVKILNNDDKSHKGLNNNLNNNNNSNNNNNNNNNNSNEIFVGDQIELATNSNINEYDFNFDPFDSNVLFNLNDMEFI